MKRILAFLLLVCMLLPFTACAPSTKDPDKDNEDDTTIEWQDSVGVKDFGGEDVVISVMDNYEYELFGEENSKEVLDQMLYKRNRAIRDRFNVNLVSLPSKTTGITDQQSHFNDVQEAMLNVDADFDLIAMFAYQSGKLITSNYYLDWRNEVPYCKDSIKAGAAWWPKGINDDCTVCGHQYVAVSDVCITAIEMAWSIVFNKDLVGNHNIAKKIGNYDTMYQVVDAGEWTLDVMKNALKDFNVAGADDTDPMDDLYGMMIQGSTGMDAFAFSLGYHYVINDGVNVPELWTPTGGTISTLETLRDFCYSKGVYYSYALGHTDDDLATFFAERHALFATLPLEHLKKDVIHEMEDAFGVLPYPKLNKQQKKYLSGTVDHYSVLSVPYTNFNTEKTGAVLEAISAYNNLYINDLYYESIVTHKNTRDPDSVRMIDIIMDGRVYDLTTYHYNDLMIIDETAKEGALGLFFRHAVAFPTEDISAYWQSGLNHLPEDFYDLIDDYMTMFS
ncbi:MAG: hypothetical protein IJY20_01840 [Clostridia bacterium]|nr:hypothetical protein [Clostridia bacterium]